MPTIVGKKRTRQPASNLLLCYLKNTGVIASLDEAGKKLLQQQSHVRVFKHSRGQAAEFPLTNKVYIIQEGRAFLSCLDPQGRKIILDTLEEGDVFGDLGLQPDLQNQDCLFMEPDKKAVICEVQRDLFSKLIESQPEFAIQLIFSLGNKIRQMSEQVGTLLFADARTKLILLLARLAQKGVDKGEFTLIPDRLIHQQLADMIGVHRETVTVILSELIRDGIVKYDKEHRIKISKEKAASKLTT